MYPLTESICYVLTLSRAMLKIALLAFTLALPSAQAQEYQIKEIDPSNQLTNALLQSTAMNGQTLGLSGFNPEPFLFSNGEIYQPKTLLLQSIYGYFTANNRDNQLVGYSNSNPANSFIWSPYPSNKLNADLQALPITPLDVNEDGDIAGYIQSAGPSYPAFIKSVVLQNLMPFLTPYGAQEGRLVSISSSGLVAGYYSAGPPLYQGCFISDGLSVTLIPQLGSNFCYMNAVNSVGQASGTIYPPPANSERAFIYNNGVTTILNPLSGYTGLIPLSTDDTGKIVGSMYKIGNPNLTRAFVYDRVTGVRDLNQLVSPAPNKILESASHINECGQITVRRENIPGAGLFVLTPRDRAFVFDPDPITTSGDLNLQDNLDQDSYELSSQRRCVKLQGLSNNGYLEGPYVAVLNQTLNEPLQVYDYGRSSSSHAGFEAAMVYYHIDKSRRYLESLNLVPAKLATAPIRAYVNVSGIERSSFNTGSSATPGMLFFSASGVDNAEDAMIILHEYAHAIQHAFVPGWGASPESAAINEGFADYWAASAFVGSGPAGHKNDLDGIFAPWRGTSLLPAQRRTLLSTKHYPEDFIGDKHADGEIWSACLWQMMLAIGKERTDRLFLEALIDVNSDISFQKLAQRVLKINENKYSGQDQDVLISIFRDRGILVRPVALTLSTAIVTGGAQISGQIYLSSKAPIGGLEIALSSSNQSASVPPTILVPDGQLSQGFPIITSSVGSSMIGEIMADYSGQTIQATLTVNP